MNQQNNSRPLTKALAFTLVGLALLSITYFRSNPASTSSSSPSLAACVTRGDCNCFDFVYQEDAQQILDTYPDDRFGLDKDHDGVACESLPSFSSSNIYDQDP